MSAPNTHNSGYPELPEEFETVRAILRGYPHSMARTDAFNCIAKLEKEWADRSSRLNGGDSAPSGAVVAWLHEDGTRSITAEQKATMVRDGGASATSVKGYSIPLSRLNGGGAMLEAITTADLQLGDGHVEAARRTLHAAMDGKPAGKDVTLPFESALSELIDKICPGLDSGNVLVDAVTASKELDKRSAGAQASPILPNQTIAVLRELLEATIAPYPPYEGGTADQEAWSLRKEAAIDSAMDLLSAAPLLPAPAQPDDHAYNGDEWELLAMALAAEEHDDIHHLIWEGGPVPEPWGEVWQKYEDDAKRIIELYRKHVAAPLPAQEGVSEEHARKIHQMGYVRSCLLEYAERMDDQTADAVVVAIAKQVLSLVNSQKQDAQERAIRAAIRLIEGEANIDGEHRSEDARVLDLLRAALATPQPPAAQQDEGAELESLREPLQFVGRWANHHGTKPHMTAQEALSCIQHYPPILAITRSYVDGKVPETPNPLAELEKLRAAPPVSQQSESALTAKQFTSSPVTPEEEERLIEAGVRGAIAQFGAERFARTLLSQQSEHGVQVAALRLAEIGLANDYSYRSFTSIPDVEMATVKSGLDAVRAALTQAEATPAPVVQPNLFDHIRWALTALSLVENKVRSLGSSTDSTELTNLAAAITTLRSIIEPSDQVPVPLIAKLYIDRDGNSHVELLDGFDSRDYVFDIPTALKPAEAVQAEGVMPKEWQVNVIAGGETLVSIGHCWLSGSSQLTDQDEQTIVGAAKHLLSFVGYGLPKSTFNPDDATTPEQTGGGK